MNDAELEIVNKELAEYKQKSDEYLNSWKRAAADFENYKKRRDRESQEIMQFAQEITVVKILPILESLEQALRQSPQDEKFQVWSDGVIKIVQQLEKVLLDMGISKIETMGKKFDPMLHEAVELAESDQESGIILEEVQSGYQLNNKIIRPAKVKVVK